MKKFKKIFAALAASALVAAMSFTSMAAASITINSTAAPGTTDNTTYTYYKILNADILYNDKKEIQSVSYYIDSDKGDLVDLITGTGLFKATKSADGSRWIVEAKNANTITAEEITTAFNQEYILDKAIATGTFEQQKSGSGSSTTVKAVKNDLTDGYYLIKSSLGTVLAVQTTGSKGVVIDEKNAYPSLTKTEDKETASYGDKIKYTVNVSIPASAAAKDIKVVDTMSTGLTPFDGDADNLLDVTAKVGAIELTGENSVTVSQNGNNIEITIPGAVVAANKNNTVTLTYQAVLNNNAKPTKAETNTAHLEYANYKSLDASVDVTTYGFELTKVDGAKKNTADRFIPAAAGDAEFTLYKTEDGNEKIYVVKDEASNTYQITTTETNNKILAGGLHHDATIVGLAKGTYYLQEDEAPTGYNKLAKRQAIVVADKAVNENKVDVENNAGIKLPSTGGMGTTVFAIVGLLVMAGAAVTLIVKKRA